MGRPQKKDIDWPGYGSYAVTASSTQDTFSVTRDLTNNFAILKVENYGELHNFYQNVTAADQAQIVLITSSR